MISGFLNGVYSYYKTYADMNRGGNPDAKKGFYAKHKNRRTVKKTTKKKGKKK
jgi:hypothetical protein